MRASPRLLAVVLLLLVSPVLRAKDEDVTIRKSTATIVLRTFDPKYPPKEMPPLKGDEAAVTESSFGCAVQVEVETTRGEDQPGKSKIVAVRADLRLDVTEWLPKGVSPKIRNHEDGHRAISEIFYSDAEKIARDLAKKYVGKELKVSRGDVDSATKQAANEFCEEYLGAVERPSQKAQEHYDQLTDHGRNRVPENKAVNKAVEGAKSGS